MTTKTKEMLQGEIRYAIRLTQRTARLYRHLQTTGIFFSILGGSAALSAVAGGAPGWLSAAGGVLLATSGAALIAVRPADKIAKNEADIRRYEALMAKSHKLDAASLDEAISEAHQGDAEEIESLRAVAFNDVALEMNRPDVLMPLSIPQKILSALA